MAIPTKFMTNVDFPGIDFTTNKAMAMIETLKIALVQTGWTTFGERFTGSNVQEIVFTNAGSGYSFKVKADNTYNSNYLLFQTAQSWSDIDNPVNLLSSQYANFTYVQAGLTCIISDDKRFYLSSTTTESIDVNHSAFTLFIGDIKPFKDTDPYVFIHIGQKPTAVDESSPPVGGSGLTNGIVGTLSFTTNNPNFNFFGQSDGSLDLSVRGSVYSPGKINFIPYDTDVEFIGVEQPTVLTPTYLMNAYASEELYGTKYANHMRGVLPGMESLITPSHKVTNVSTMYDNVIISGKVYSLFPYASGYYPTTLVSLDDWG